MDIDPFIIQASLITGGCGAMYEVHVESKEFQDKRTVQQHQMVNEVSTAFILLYIKIILQYYSMLLLQSTLC